MLMLPPSRNTWSYKMLETFIRDRTLPIGEPVTGACAFEASGKKTFPVGGTKGTGSGVGATPNYRRAR